MKHGYYGWTNNETSKLSLKFSGRREITETFFTVQKMSPFALYLNLTAVRFKEYNI